MAKLREGRFTALMEGDFVVFLIGARINQMWAVQRWLPVTRAMPRMLQELMRQPELGLLHAEALVGWRSVHTVQYWRSYEHLHAYAHAQDKEHLPAWTDFQKRARGNASVGIYHESFLVPAGGYETVYGNMPPFGLGMAGKLVPAVGSMANASARLRRGMPGG